VGTAFSQVPSDLLMDPDMTLSAIRVWHTIYVETLGRPGWDLSYGQIAEKIGTKRRQTAMEAVALLLDKGWLVRVKQKSNDGDDAPNLFAICREPQVPWNVVRSSAQGGALGSTTGGALRSITGGALERTHRETHIPEESLPEEESIRAARGGQDGSVKIGNLSDDVEMPEAGVAPAKKAPAKTGTHAWAKAEFVRLMRAARCGQTGTTQGVLNSAFKRLRDEGYSNEEIVALAQTFFTRHDQEIRAKRTEIDPSVMFVQRLPQLKAIKAEEIENKRAGVKTSFERGTEIQREAMKRLGITEESA
jgi:hypothetical protein